MPTLTVRRDRGWVDRFRNYKIVVDGSEIGRLAEGDLLRQEIATGSHVIEARIDWCGSQPLEFEASSEDLTVLVANATQDGGVLSTIYFLAFKRRNYLCLRLADPALQSTDTSDASLMLAAVAERLHRPRPKRPSAEHGYTVEERRQQLVDLAAALPRLIEMVRTLPKLLHLVPEYEGALVRTGELLKQGFDQAQLSSLSRSVPDAFIRHEEWSPPLELHADGSWREPEWFAPLEERLQPVLKAAGMLRELQAGRTA
jgi:hypothetical protein